MCERQIITYMGMICQSKRPELKLSFTILSLYSWSLSKYPDE